LLQKFRHTGSGAGGGGGVTVIVVITVIAIKETLIMNSVLSLADIFIQIISWWAPSRDRNEKQWWTQGRTDYI